MKLAAYLAAPLLFAADPASATAGFECRSTAPEGTSLSIVIGTGMGGGIVSASLSKAGRTLRTGHELSIGQNWIDERNLLLDLLDARGEARVARLKIGQRGPLESRNLIGTLEYDGVIARVVCRPEH